MPKTKHDEVTLRLQNSSLDDLKKEKTILDKKLNVMRKWLKALSNDQNQPEQNSLEDKALVDLISKDIYEKYGKPLSKKEFREGLENQIKNLNDLAQKMNEIIRHKETKLRGAGLGDIFAKGAKNKAIERLTGKNPTKKIDIKGEFAKLMVEEPNLFSPIKLLDYFDHQHKGKGEVKKRFHGLFTSKTDAKIDVKTETELNEIRSLLRLVSEKPTNESLKLLYEKLIEQQQKFEVSHPQNPSERILERIVNNMLEKLDDRPFFTDVKNVMATNKPLAPKKG